MKNCGWKIAEGWIESADSKDVRRVKLLSLKENRDEYEVQEFIKLEEKYKADWITGFEYVETSDFTDEGISKVRICTDKYFLRPRAKNKEIFAPPHLLIKENVTGKSIPVVYSERYLTFKDQIFGVHSPMEQCADLQELGDYIGSKHCVPSCGC